MELFKQHVETGEVLHCEKHDECGGFIKPAVTFFGEKLPGDFASNFGLIKEADLVVVMGTSLQVEICRQYACLMKLKAIHDISILRFLNFFY